MARWIQCTVCLAQPCSCYLIIFKIRGRERLWGTHFSPSPKMLLFLANMSTLSSACRGQTVVPTRILLDGVPVVVIDTFCLLAKGQECVRDYNCGLKQNGYVLSCNKFLRVCFRENRCNSVAVHDWIRARNEGNCCFHSVLEVGGMDFWDLYRKTTLNQDPIESKAISV